MAGIEQLARENIGQVTSKRRVKCVKHVVRKVEKSYQETDSVVENAVDHVVIELRRGEASESEEAFVSDGDGDFSN